MTEIITRELVTGSATDGNKDLYLVLDDQHGDGKDKYRRYLATSATFPSNEPPAEHELRIATARFNSIDNIATQATTDLTSGWLYLFINGKVWREIEVLGRYQYRDVNLTRYIEQPEDARPAECMPRDTIVIPVSFAGEAMNVQAAHSEQQWSWARIDELGGFEASKADRQSAAEENPLRDQRCTLLDYLQQETVDKADMFAISPLTVHDYQLMDMPRQDLIFSLPNWLAMGHTLRKQHDEVIGEITHLQQALVTPDYYLPRLAPGPDQQQQAELAARALPLAIMTANEVGYGQAKRNLLTSNSAHQGSLMDEATKQRLEAGRERLALKKCVDMNRLEAALHTDEFLALYEKANDIKEAMIEFLQEPRLIATMRDFATLGSDEKSATRVKGLVAFAEMFDGFNISAFGLIEPYLGDSEHTKISRQDQINPMLGFIPKLLNLEGQPIDLFYMILDFEALYPKLYSDFMQGLLDYQRDAADINNMSFAQRYNPQNKGIVDELIELIGDKDAQKVVQSLFKLFAGLMALDERELTTEAKTHSAAASDSHVAKTDDYDEVIQKQKKQILDLENEEELLREEHAKLGSEIQEQEKEIDNQKAIIQKSEKQKADLEAQYRISEPTSAQIEELENVKATVKVEEGELKKLETDLGNNQNLQQGTEEQLRNVQHKITITKNKITRQPSGHAPDRMTATTVDSNIEMSLSTKSQLRVGEMTHFVGGSQVVRVKMNLNDLVEGRFPAHLLPTNAKGIEQLQTRRRNALNLVTETGGPLVQVEALGVRFPVPAHALHTNNHDVQWALTGLAADMIDHQRPNHQQRPASTVDLYCFRADIDIDLSERQWAALQQYKVNSEVYAEYLKASDTLKTQQFDIIQARHKLDDLRSEFLRMGRAQKQALDDAKRYRDSNFKLIQRDRHIHWVQGPLQGVVLIFDLNNMISKWQALQRRSSLLAWWDAGTSVIDVAGSVVDTAESLFRMPSAHNTYNYHNLKNGIRSGFRVVGKALGLAGAVISVVSGILDLITARTLNDHARYVGGALTILSGVGMIAAIIIGSVPLAILAIGLGVFATIFSAFYETAEETHWLKSFFGKEHDQHKGVPGLENWDDPAICEQGLRSLLCRPTIDITKDDYHVTVTVETSVLAMHTLPEIELDIKADYNIGNEDEYPWQPLHNRFIASTDTKAMVDAMKQDPDNKGLMSTYGVTYDRLSNGAHPTQTGNQTQYRYDRRLFEEMLEEIKKNDTNWYRGMLDIDDLLFQIRVRGIGNNKQPNLPSGYFDETFKPDQDMKQEKVEQTRYYTHNGLAWWYQKEFELDLS